ISPIYSRDAVRSTFRRNHRQFFSTGLLGIAASAFRPPVPLPPSNITTDQDFEIPVDCSGRKPQTRFFDEKDRGEHPVLRRLQLFFSSQYHKTNTLTTLYKVSKLRRFQRMEVSMFSQMENILDSYLESFSVSPIYSGDAVRSTFRRNHRQFFSTGLLGIAASASRPPAPLPPSNTTTDQDFEIPVDCSGRKP
ncbi:hypothetical protein F2Q68_00018038, partial [Brassica cretica]